MVQSQMLCGSSKTSIYLSLDYLIHFMRRNYWVCANSRILLWKQLTFTDATRVPKT